MDQGVLKKIVNIFWTGKYVGWSESKITAQSRSVSVSLNSALPGSYCGTRPNTILKYPPNRKHWPRAPLVLPLYDQAKWNRWLDNLELSVGHEGKKWKGGKIAALNWCKLFGNTSQA
jgi:hypothetical protein